MFAGTRQCGKTSIINRLCFKKFDDDYFETEDVKEYRLNKKIDKHPFDVVLVDTPDIEEKRSIVEAEIPNSNVIVILGLSIKVYFHFLNNSLLVFITLI